MFEHLYGLGVAQSFAMQTSEMVPQAGVFPFDSNHVSFAYNLVPLRNKLRINGVAIGDIKVALPQFHEVPQGLKRFATMVTDDPPENSSFEVVYGSP